MPRPCLGSLYHLMGCHVAVKVGMWASVRGTIALIVGNDYQRIFKVGKECQHTHINLFCDCLRKQRF